MVKIFSTGDQEELLRAAGGRLCTLIDTESHIKQASSSAFTEEMIRNHLPDKNHFASHLIGLGASEYYGFNRNGDFWPEKELIDRSDTFVKHGHFFREHNNRDPKFKIGDIKAAAYNPEMQRTELIVWGDKEKAAKEYARAKAGKEASYSMSSRIAYDVCSICENKAKSSKLYCPHLKHSMTRFIKSASKFAYAINVRPTFFDLSDVENPADRIAHFLEYRFSPDDEMEKAASVDFPFSDELAKAAGVCLPDSSEHKGHSTVDGRKFLNRFASLEDYIDQVTNNASNVVKDAQFYFLKEAGEKAFRGQHLTDDEIAALRTVPTDVLWHMMAKRAMVFPFLDFCAYTSGQKLADTANDLSVKYAQTKLLPNLYRDLLTDNADEGMEALFEAASLFKVSCAGVSDPIDRILDKVQDRVSMDRPVVRMRIMHATTMLPDESVKFASIGLLSKEVESKAKNLAKAFALYKLAFVEAASNIRGAEFIDEPVCLLLNIQHKI